MRISIGNLFIWLRDQLTHPSTLLEKRSWGVFSKYAHVRRSDQRPKPAHTSKDKALQVAENMSNKYGGSYTIYKCLYCDGWHVAKVSDTTDAKNTPSIATWSPSKQIVLQVSTPHKPISEINKEVHSKYYYPSYPTKLDIEKILALDIPDIAQVYGGVRGRTMSSVHQNYAWPIISEAGVRTIIDLREDGVYTRLNNLCEQYGMKYLYYPVDTRCNHIDQMIELFPQLCQFIDEGNFYIACAMGLHRTDIALCTYWVFHGADKGIAPPVICGYKKSSGHNTDKIMRVLNAFYSSLTQKNGIPPMSAEVFKERKDIIKRQSEVY